MGGFGSSTITAVLTGVVLAVVAFVPVVAHRYRAAGRLRFLDLLTLLAVAVYAMALWTYTLIPIPQSSDYPCAGANFTPLAFVQDVVDTRGQGSLLTNSALLHAVFNVVLFVPMGGFLRWLAKRGVLVATMTGLVTSTVIECTQLTGVWGLLPCAYRVFDVDDLILNTAGALLGSAAAWPFVRRAARRGADALPTRVTVGRRLVGVLVDLILVGFVNSSLVIGWRVARLALGFGVEPAGDPVQSALGWLPALVLEGWWVLARGRTCGEAVVALRPVEPDGRKWPRRLVKLVMGVGGYLALIGVEWDWNTLSVGAFSLASLIAILAAKDHRGLSGLAAGLPMAPDAAQEDADQ